ncbi:trypsin-like peptidase domain-containing protein [Streptomyces atriruber]|uniref:Trypsin-like peptidase domain-containing protein n=1 Tax=Streptomyces atriruber TaxID=545121 RepID=A0ABV3BTY1_9ACTN
MSEPAPRLDALAQAATVHLLAADGAEGTDGGAAGTAGAPGDTAMWGSGFFVAPGWVLTCAHVLRPYLARDRERTFAVRGTDLNDGIPVAARLAHWLIGDHERSVVPPEEDLALVRLLDDTVEHECVWLADRAVRPFGDVVAYGYRPDVNEGSAGAKPWSADAEINVRDDGVGLRFKSDIAFPKGVSGGPLLDPRTGAVVGLIKSRRREHDGGMAVATLALRRFGEAYRTVTAAHDRWHGTAPRVITGDNWIDEQQRLLGAERRPGPDQWSPKDRRNALGLLARLPDPGAAPSVAKIVRKVRGRRPPGAVPALLTWRDGHGLLYDSALPEDALTFLHYLRLVAAYVRSRGGDAERLEEWVAERLGEDDRTHLHALVTEARLPDGLLPGPEGPDRAAVPYPGPGEGPTVTVLLDPVISVTPARFHWQIWVNHGDHADDEETYQGAQEGTYEEAYEGDFGRCDMEMAAEDYSGEGFLPGELVQALRAPLSRTLHRLDGEGPPVPLEFALPAEHFDTQVHRWQFDDIAKLYATERLGTQRRVVLRDLARRADPDNPDWHDRWRSVAAARELAPARVPERDSRPHVRHFQKLPHTAIPVMCRPAGRGVGRDAMKLALGSGHGVVLWHIEGHATRGCQDTCEDLHAGVEQLLGRLGSVAELPDRIRHIRQDISSGRDDRHWAEPLALLYDDPRRPLPPEDTMPADSP